LGHSKIGWCAFFEGATAEGATAKEVKYLFFEVRKII
jgi:hypothetical protein